MKKPTTPVNQEVVLEDEETSVLEQGVSLKDEGNSFFKRRDYESALRSYNSALGVLLRRSPERANVLANKAAALLELGRVPPVLESEALGMSSASGDDARRSEMVEKLFPATDKTSLPAERQRMLNLAESILRECVEINPRQRKARVRLARIFTEEKEWLSACSEWKNVEGCEGPLSEAEKAELAKAEKASLDLTVTTLKGWGNKILNKFGLSTDNFKVQKNADGSMNMQFVQDTDSKNSD